MTINIFAIILCPVRRDFVHSVQRVKYISDLSVLFKTNPILALSLALNLFSMAGLPPLAGFWGKYYLLFSAFSSDLYIVAIVGGVATVFSSVYYIRLVHISYFDQIQNRLIFQRVPIINAWVLGLTLWFIIFLFLAPDLLFLICHKAALSLCY